MSQEDRLIIIDTDAGVDDALALFMVLKAHKDPNIRLKILAITCVTGNTTVDNVCVNVTRVLQTAGVSDIPVYRGAEKATVVRPVRVAAPYHGSDGFGDGGLPTINPKIEEEHAVVALIRLLGEYPGRITLVAIGPLTNVALAMNLSPSIIPSIKELYIMGGNTLGHGNIQACAEFNFWWDPEAAFIVLEAPLAKKIILVPLETCKIEARFSMEWRTECLGKLTTPECVLQNKIESISNERNKEKGLGYVSCDALATAVLLNPKVINKQESLFCTVELHGNYTRGQMVVDYPRLSGKEDNLSAVTKVNLDEYGKMLVWALGGPHFDE